MFGVPAFHVAVWPDDRMLHNGRGVTELLADLRRRQQPRRQYVLREAEIAHQVMTGRPQRPGAAHGEYRIRKLLQDPPERK